MKFDENLAAIHAYLCSDGYVIKNPRIQKHKYYYIGFRNTDLKLLRDFQIKFYRYFKVKPRLKPRERCVVQKKEIYNKLIKSFNSFYSKEWSMPEMEGVLVGIWLRAFFDCEGWVFCKSHQNRHVGIDSVNEKGLDQIKKALERLGINSKIRKRIDRGIYSLNIFGKDNIIKFKDKVGFLHPKKKEKLNNLIEDYITYEWKFPNNQKDITKFIRNKIKEKARMRKDNGVIRLISNKEENLLKIQEALKQIFDIESKVGKRINGVGTIYFEICINKNSEINKLFNNNLIKEDLKKEWEKLKSRK